MYAPSVGHLMSSPVQTVTPETPIHDAAETMLDRDIGSLVVVDEDDRPEGILTTTDCVALVAGQDSTDDTLVAEHMTTGVETVVADAAVQDAANRMMTNGIHHLPVVSDNDSVIGILTTTDLTAYLSPDWTPNPS
jgi:CBS domain-containing protein